MLKSALSKANVALLKPRNVAPVLAATNTDWAPKDQKTHTGQQWESDDYRLARFIGRPKHVNTQFAIDLIDQEKPKPCKERVVSCDGGGGPLGHPKVYINLDKPGNHVCGYCGLRFFLQPHHH